MAKDVSLMGFKVNKIEFSTIEGIKNGTQFKIVPKIECKVGRKENMLIASLSARVNEDISSPVPFNLSVSILANFKVINELEQSELVKEVMDELYPHLRAAITGITANAYIPPYVLPPLSQNAEMKEENKGDGYRFN